MAELYPLGSIAYSKGRIADREWWRIRLLPRTRIPSKQFLIHPRRLHRMPQVLSRGVAGRRGKTLSRAPGSAALISPMSPVLFTNGSFFFDARRIVERHSQLRTSWGPTLTYRLRRKCLTRLCSVSCVIPTEWRVLMVCTLVGVLARWNFQCHSARWDNAYCSYSLLSASS